MRAYYVSPDRKTIIVPDVMDQPDAMLIDREGVFIHIDTFAHRSDALAAGPDEYAHLSDWGRFCVYRIRDNSGYQHGLYLKVRT